MIENVISYFAGIATVLLAIYIYFHKYKKIVLSVNLDEVKDSIIKIFDAIKDTKINKEEKEKLIKEIRDSVSVSVVDLVAGNEVGVRWNIITAGAAGTVFDADPVRLILMYGVS